MPQPPSGDTGEGHDADDSTDDPVEFRPPLPPEDRIWRHPSEVAAAARVPTEDSTRTNGTRNTVALVTAAALIGATLSIGVVAALGGFETRTRVVERQVAIQPVTNQGDEGLRAITERTSPSIAGVYVDHDDDRRAGTAVVLRSDGYLMTTATLVADAASVEVRMHGQPMVSAEVIGTDPVTDIAVLHVDADDLDPAPVGSADGVRVGHDAIVVGHSMGGDTGASVDRTAISAIDRRLRTEGGSVLYGMILLDDVPHADAHGGALLDDSGALIGIARAVPATDEAADDWYGVATPIDVAVRAADEIIEHGHVRHVWLGIEGTDLDAATATAMSLAGGATIEDVVAESPASASELRAGDVVVRVGDEPVHTMSELIAALRRHEPGDEVVLGLRRGDETFEVTVALGERPVR